MMMATVDDGCLTVDYGPWMLRDDDGLWLLRDACDVGDDGHVDV